MTKMSFVRPAAVMAVLAIAPGLLLLTSGSVRGQEPTPNSTPAVLAHASAFFGSVTINGEPAPDGTPIEALIGDVVCGTTTTSDGRYSISVNAGYGVGNYYQEGCGGGDETVVFRSGERIANERGTFRWDSGRALDLTFGTAPSVLPGTGSGAPDSGGSYGTPIAVAALAAGALIAVAAWWARRSLAARR